MTRELIVEILAYLIQLAVLAGLGFLIRFLVVKTGEINFKRYREVIQVAVNAVEQTMGGQPGAVKKQEVVVYLQKIIGNGLCAEEIDKLIEAAVFEMKPVVKDYTSNAPPAAPVTQVAPPDPPAPGPPPSVSD